MGHLGVVLYEYLGEEYPEVLGSILGALKAIVNVIGKPCYHDNHTCVFSCCFQTVYVGVCRYAQDDPAHQRPASSPHPHPEEQTREGAGELHRPGGEDRRQVGGAAGSDPGPGPGPGL